MDTTLLISVVIPTYNRKESLCRCLNSVAANDLNSCEVLVVDDGSVDDTQMIVNEKFPWVRYIYQSNKGVSAARNLGMREANGKFIAFLDSDDIWYSDRLSILKEVLNALPDLISLVFNDMDYLNGSRGSGVSCSDGYFGKKSTPAINAMKHTREVLTSRGSIVTRFGNIYTQLIEGNILQPSCVLLNRQVFLSEGGFREDFRVANDSEYFLRIAPKVNFAYVPLILTSLEKPKLEGSLSSPVNSIEKITNMITAIQEHRKVSGSDQSITETLERRKAELLALRAYHYLTDLDLQNARGDYRAAMHTGVFRLKYFAMLLLAYLPPGVIKTGAFCKQKLKRDASQ